jgi:hypothetical protein
MRQCRETRVTITSSEARRRSARGDFVHWALAAVLAALAMSGCGGAGGSEAWPTTADATAGTSRRAPSSTTAEDVPAPPLAQTSEPPPLRSDDRTWLNNADDVLQTRVALLRFIFKGRNPFERLPDETRALVLPSAPGDAGFPLDPRLARRGGLELVVRMAHGIESRVYLTHATTPGDCLAVYHQGHGNELRFPRAASITLLTTLQDRGCDLLLVSQPLLAPNPAPRIEVPGIGTVTPDYHTVFEYLESDTYSGISAFMEPVFAAVNFMTSQRPYARVMMVGLSGGGWATTLYSALDERIQFSAQVAGTVPLIVRAENVGDWGDYEQVLPALYRIAGYMDLYAMAASNGRRHLHVLIVQDDCCFKGRRMEPYGERAAEGAARLGGRYELAFDEVSTTHEISAWTQALILERAGS